jgi:hypothetical protein
MLEGGLAGPGNDRKSPVPDSTQQWMRETTKCSWGAPEWLNLFVDGAPAQRRRDGAHWRALGGLRHAGHCRELWRHGVEQRRVTQSGGGELKVAKWTLASSTGHDRDKDGWRSTRGCREAGGGRSALNVGERW